AASGCVGEVPDRAAVSVGPAPTLADGSVVTDVELRVTARINEVREEHGVAPLELNPDLVAVARAYSCRMADEDFFAHESPDGDNVADRIADAGISYRVVGENLAYAEGSQPRIERVIDGWM